MSFLVQWFKQTLKDSFITCCELFSDLKLDFEPLKNSVKTNIGICLLYPLCKYAFAMNVLVR